MTTIEGASEWYPAEDYHQEYWEGEGQRNPYCLAVIPPKLMKLQQELPEQGEGGLIPDLGTGRPLARTGMKSRSSANDPIADIPTRARWRMTISR